MIPRKPPRIHGSSTHPITTQITDSPYYVRSLPSDLIWNYQQKVIQVKKDKQHKSAKDSLANFLALKCQPCWNQVVFSPT